MNTTPKRCEKCNNRFMAKGKQKFCTTCKKALNNQRTKKAYRKNKEPKKFSYSKVNKCNFCPNISYCNRPSTKKKTGNCQYGIRSGKVS